MPRGAPAGAAARPPDVARRFMPVSLITTVSFMQTHALMTERHA